MIARFLRLVPISRPSLPVPRWPLSVLDDIRTIALSTRVLPDVLERLASIEGRVESLNREVTRMRQGVDSVGGDVIDLRESVEPIKRTAERFGWIAGRRRRGTRAE